VAQLIAVSATERGLALVILLPLTYLAVRGIGRFRQLCAKPMDTREYRGWLNSPSLFLSGTSVLLDHPVADVDRAGSLEHAHQLELRLSRLEAVEEPLPRAEDHRGHLEVDLVDQSGLEGLLGA
jgi:hypothetical protein